MCSSDLSSDCGGGPRPRSRSRKICFLQSSAALWRYSTAVGGSFRHDDELIEKLCAPDGFRDARMGDYVRYVVEQLASPCRLFDVLLFMQQGLRHEEDASSGEPSRGAFGWLLNEGTPSAAPVAGAVAEPRATFGADQNRRGRGTGDPEFKRRVFALYRQGKSQRVAMEQAAREFGISLPEIGRAHV